MLDTTSELRFIFNFLNNKKDTLFSVFKNGAATRNCTKDTGIFSPLLYQLSYCGIFYSVFIGVGRASSTNLTPVPLRSPRSYCGITQTSVFIYTFYYINFNRQAFLLLSAKGPITKDTFLPSI